MKIRRIDIGKDFAMSPGMRHRTDGPFSGEEFRESILAPAFRENDMIVVLIDTPVGLGASFLEESFGGLVRIFGLDEVRRKLRIETAKRGFLLPIIESDMIRAELARGKRKGAGE